MISGYTSFIETPLWQVHGIFILVVAEHILPLYPSIHSTVLRLLCDILGIFFDVFEG